jgi:hypothetical protein
MKSWKQQLTSSEDVDEGVEEGDELEINLSSDAGCASRRPGKAITPRSSRNHVPNRTRVNRKAVQGSGTACRGH